MHSSPATQNAPAQITQASGEKLKQFVAKVERLEEEKRGLAGDVKDTYAEAKAFGFDTKALRQIIALRRKDRREREEQEQIVDLYLHAIGEL